MPRRTLLAARCLFALLLAPPAFAAEAPAGYYRFPALHGDTVVFTAEGDLWTVPASGGTARRLTTHLGPETHPAFSPDGGMVAFSANYEGPTEVYVMPAMGGLPRRLTWDGEDARVVGWTTEAEPRVVYATRHYSTLPEVQLVRVDPVTAAAELVPLAQASDGVYGPDGTLYFTRLPFQGSFTKRYRGGTAQQLWRFAPGAPEAVPLTVDYPGTSRAPMLWEGRLYFASDRDGTMNIWSMVPSMALEGGDLRQHTRHAGWDVKWPELSRGRIVYALGADLRLLDLATGEDREIPVRLSSDFDQMRERWIDEPMEYLTAAHLSPSGDRVVLTARGQVFVEPVTSGRRVEASPGGVRVRDARFLDGESLVALSDESGEVELWRLDARGVAPREQLTRGGETLRFEAVPSPDGRRVAYVEKDLELWILDVESGRQTRAATALAYGFRDLAWSPDGRYLAYVTAAENLVAHIELYDAEGGARIPATSDRFHSYSPAWSRDGHWLYFLSERNLESLTPHPWGPHAPQPYLDRKVVVYGLALRRGLRSPFAPPDELHPPEEKKKDNGKAADAAPRVEIDVEGLGERLWRVPVEPGNYSSLAAGEGFLYWLEAETARQPKLHLEALEITHREDRKPVRIAGELEAYELSRDAKKILLRQKQTLYVVDAGGRPAKKLADARVPLAGWRFALDPREEWRQMFVDAWRLLRDYFYDPGMHGVDWRAALEKYLPLVDRVTDRAELSDLFGELTGELSTLHHYVRGGDHREGEKVEPASLGAVLERDEDRGGFRVVEVYRADPDLPEERSPLARPGVEVSEGDVLVAINGVPALSVPHPGVLLRDQAGKQVLLAVRDASGTTREAIVEPLTPDQAEELRYDAWEYERRLRVEELSGGRIGYVHLRAMGGENYGEWARHYFPVFDRPGLLVDVRHNRGGNIDSWILGSLIRPRWMWWKPRAGQVYSNMQLAFGGHLAVLVDPFTASDGEAFAEGFRRLGLGKVIGTRTWGGEIWLTSSNFLVDKGIATAAEFGVYGPEGEWLIEGHGVDPDLVVDNLPHATFRGEDAQLEAAVAHLLERIREDPPVVPEPPLYPDKSFRPEG